VITPRFDDGSSFSEGLAVVAIGKGIAPRVAGKKCSYIDSQGKTVIEGPFDMAADFHSGIAYVEIADHQCWIDKTGNEILCSPPR